MATINKLWKFNETAGLTVYHLIKKSKRNQINSRGSFFFSQYLFINLIPIVKEMNIEISKFMKLLHDSDCTGLEGCKVCRTRFLKIFDIEKLFKDYLNVCAENNPLLKNY